MTASDVAGQWPATPGQWLLADRLEKPMAGYSSIPNDASLNPPALSGSPTCLITATQRTHTLMLHKDTTTITRTHTHTHTYTHTYTTTVYLVNISIIRIIERLRKTTRTLNPRPVRNSTREIDKPKEN